MKNTILLMLVLLCTALAGQQQLTGRVTAEDGTVLQNVQVRTADGRQTSTAADGRFTLSVPGSHVQLILSSPGFETRELTVSLPLQKELSLSLTPKTAAIEEVTLRTGYQTLSKERATGSYSAVTSSDLQKQVSANILDRLPATANGVMVDNNVSSRPQLTVRGLSTLHGPRSPLIILDDFPYEGDVNALNPESIESITILKDAAAASIWGARAANGVIVLTSKKGRYGQPVRVDLLLNNTITGRPDLSYIRQMSSADYIGVEQEMFARGFYNSDIASPYHAVLTPVVDLLHRQQQGLITDAEVSAELDRLKKVDMRDQYRQYMYMPSLKQQYSLNLSGGAARYSWQAGLGYDDQTGNLEEKLNRTTFRTYNSWKLLHALTITAGIDYSQLKTKSGRSGYGSITMNNNWRIPYMEFAGPNGEPLVLPTGINQQYKESIATPPLLDWNHYPLTDWQHRFFTDNTTQVLVNTGISYKVLPGLEAEARYGLQRADGLTERLYDKDSYYARHYVNSFAQKNAAGAYTFIVPKGGILERMNMLSTVQNLRGQLNYSYRSDRHELTALVGGEMRAGRTESEHNRYYGYDPSTKISAAVDYTRKYPNLISGASDYILKMQSMQLRSTRFMSLFANASYTFRDKYTLYGSARRDASNLFGLKTNEQWNPFWSVAGSWKISGENFYPAHSLPALKLRTSYGFNGNIDPSMVAVTTIAYDSAPSIYTGTGTARIDNFYNPRLRWETSRIINIGLDVGTPSNRFSGSLDLFTKKGSNLFGAAPLDYTTGITSMLWNVAAMEGKGLDLQLAAKPVLSDAWNWSSVLNFSLYKDHVTDYYVQNTFASNYVSLSGSSVPVSGVAGLPVYSIFAYRWAGLDPQTGDPRGYFDGDLSTDYAAITGSDQGVESLQYFGSALPTVYGSFNNTVAYRNFSVDIGITYKMGYWFRRGSIDYTSLLTNRIGHSDFALRWQQPGDELRTDVPSFLYVSNSSRDQFYNGSAALVEKGDHIRLQYVNLSYRLSPGTLRQLPVSSAQIYVNAANLGLLWKANKQGLDPDYAGAEALPLTASYSLGLRVNF